MEVLISFKTDAWKDNCPLMETSLCHDEFHKTGMSYFLILFVTEARRPRFYLYLSGTKYLEI